MASISDELDVWFMNPNEMFFFYVCRLFESACARNSNDSECENVDQSALSDVDLLQLCALIEFLLNSISLVIAMTIYTPLN